MGLERYYQLTTQAVTNINAEMPVFHNLAISPCKRDVLKKRYFSHPSWSPYDWRLGQKTIFRRLPSMRRLDWTFGMTGNPHTG